MLRIANLALRRPKRTIGVWLVATAILISQIGSLESRLVQPNYDVPGTEHMEARGLIDETFGANLQFPVLLTGKAAVLDRRGPAYADRLERGAKTSVLSPWDSGDSERLLRPRPGAAMLLVIVDRPEEEGLEAARDVEERVEAVVRPPVRAHITGQQTIGVAQQEEGIESTEKAEVIALPLLLAVLLLVFRSVVAALIPAVFGALIVAGGFGALSVLAAIGHISAGALSLASMMGLALGVDYSLLIVARFREELAAGRGPEQSARAAFTAATTAGRTVAFAALTLSAAMVTGLALAPGSFLVSAVVGVGVAVTLSAVSAILVIPPVLALLGPRIDRWSIGRGASGRPGRAATVARRALRRPALAALVILIPLLAFGSQALAIEPGTPGADLLPEDNRARKDFETVTKALGPGWSVPFEVIAVAPEGTITEERRLRTLNRLQRAMARDPGVALTLGPRAVSQRTRSLRRLPAQMDRLGRTLEVGRRSLGRLDAGLSGAESGVQELRSGIARAASAAEQLAAGGRVAGDGAERVAGGLARAGAGTDRLLDVLRRIERGADTLAGGTARARSGAGAVERGLRRIRRGVTGGMPRQRRLEAALRQGAGDLARLREPAQVANSELERAYRLLLAMSTGRLDPNYSGALDAVGRASAAVSGRDPVTGAPVRPGYEGLDASLARGSTELGRAADGVAEMIRGTRRLSGGLARLHGGVGRLRRGLGRLRAGAAELSAAVQRTRAAVVSDVDGIRRLARGARELADGIERLAVGSARLRDGLAAGSARTAPLENGLARMDAGVVRFRGRLPGSGGVARFARQSPRTLRSGHLVLAAVDGSKRDARQQAQAVVSASTGGRAARIFVVPRTDASSPATARLRPRLASLADRVEERSGLDVAVGGQAALVLEYDDAITDRLPLLILGFVVVTYLVLIPFFRALLLPLIAVVLNVLTVAAAAGVLVLLFQGSAPLGGPGYIDAVVMLGIFGIVFGLSIDYEVFLLGRMREGWLRTRRMEEAIAFGLDRTAGVVTGAAAIMLAVFFAFSLSGFVPTKQFGIGLFVAVLLDATVVRLVLLPAAMRLCGPVTWWLPAWLDRLLPRLEDEPVETPHDGSNGSGAGRERLLVHHGAPVK